jgi:prophage antirepressor-like protein
MNTQPTVFQFNTATLRTITRDGEPWFVAADVCHCLGIVNVTQATQGLDVEDKAMFNIGLPGKAPLIVNESGLYSLIMSSRKPEARAFKRWVTSEVLPSIRKTGMYLTAETAKQVTEAPDDFLARAVLVAVDRMKDAEQRVAVLEPQAYGLDPTLEPTLSTGAFLAKHGLKVKRGDSVRLGQRTSAFADAAGTIGHRFKAITNPLTGAQLVVKQRLYPEATLDRAAKSLGLM